MVSWVLEWLWWLAWYGVVVGGWWCWWRAHVRAARLDRELTVMASSLRYAADRPREQTRYG